MKLKLLFSTMMVLMVSQLYGQGQGDYKWVNKEDSVKVYQGGEKYPVKFFNQDFETSKPENIILMIGDGMGVSQVFAGLTANGGQLFLNNFKHIGFSKTQSTNSYITDSAAGGTALSTGVKTYNGAIAMVIDVKGDTIPVKTVLEMAEDKGLSTGLIATDVIVGATPAVFIAHQKSRNYFEAIATDFLKTEIDVFIGGGYKYFIERKDGRDLTFDLKKRGYQVLQTMEEIIQVKSGKLAGLPVFDETQPASRRNMNLLSSTETALNILSNNKKGFFLMVEGSQIDWGRIKTIPYMLYRKCLNLTRQLGRCLNSLQKMVKL